MHPQATNSSARSFNDHRFDFEPAGALGFPGGNHCTGPEVADLQQPRESVAADAKLTTDQYSFGRNKPGLPDLGDLAEQALQGQQVRLAQPLAQRGRRQGQDFADRAQARVAVSIAGSRNGPHRMC